jgi:hypothetical protein
MNFFVIPFRVNCNRRAAALPYNGGARVGRKPTGLLAVPAKEI